MDKPVIALKDFTIYSLNKTYGHYSTLSGYFIQKTPETFDIGL